METIQVKHSGLVDYMEWQVRQRALLRLRQAEACKDTLYLVEHPPVFTLGRNTNIEEHLPADYNRNAGRLYGIPVVKTERGGGVMFHNPGQLVAYPIIRLRKSIRNVRRFMWLIEESILQALAEFGVYGFRQPEIHPGVWTRKGKIGFIGIAIQRGIVFHGFAINVTNELQPFQWIATCGLKNGRITSVQETCDAIVNLAEFQQVLGQCFTRVWDKNVLTSVAG